MLSDDQEFLRMLAVFVNTEICKIRISEIFVKLFVRFYIMGPGSALKNIAESSALVHLTYAEESVDLSRKISVCNCLVLCNADNPGEATSSSSLLCIT